VTKDPRDDLPLMIWAEQSIPPKNQPFLLWNHFDQPDQHSKSISLPLYIEENALRIRKKLLRFLSELKGVEVDSSTLESALNLNQGPSMWWMSLAVMKRLGEPSVPIACRLIAIEEIVGESALDNLGLICSDRKLANIIRFALGQHPSLTTKARRAMVNYVFGPILAIGSFVRYLFLSLKLELPRLNSECLSNAPQIFVDYLGTLPDKQSATSSYVPPFLGKASELVQDPTWYHILPKNLSRKSISNASKFVQDLRSSSVSQHHLFICRLRVQDYRNTLCEYLHCLKAHRRFDKRLRQFRASSSKVVLWWAFSELWDSSVCSTTSIRHLLLLKTSLRIADSIPPQSHLYYPIENQPWEIALTHFARHAGINLLVGVAHSTVRFWDIRYFFDQSENRFLNQQAKIPGPDRILVNNFSSQKLLIDNGNPKSTVGVVEALRYQYLLAVKRLPPRSILVLADFSPALNSHLLEVCNQALGQTFIELPILVRSHPICPLSTEQLGSFSKSLTFDPLNKLFEHAAVVITTASSSSAAEAVSLGIPTILVADPTSLNYSPFRESELVSIAHSSGQLCELILKNQSSPPIKTEEVFLLDPHLSAWRAELGNLNS
jgi:surface carbohydrate biosynthesis protein (TIGR04326 family)